MSCCGLDGVACLQCTRFGGEIRLDVCESVSQSNASHLGAAFQIKSKSRTVTLAAATTEKRDEWMNAIRKGISIAKNPNESQYAEIQTKPETLQRPASQLEEPSPYSVRSDHSVSEPQYAEIQKKPETLQRPAGQLEEPSPYSVRSDRSASESQYAEVQKKPKTLQRPASQPEEPSPYSVAVGVGESIEVKPVKPVSQPEEPSPYSVVGKAVKSKAVGPGDSCEYAAVTKMRPRGKTESGTEDDKAVDELKDFLRTLGETDLLAQTSVSVEEAESSFKELRDMIGLESVD